MKNHLAPLITVLLALGACGSGSDGTGAAGSGGTSGAGGSAGSSAGGTGGTGNGAGTAGTAGTAGSTGGAGGSAAGRGGGNAGFGGTSAGSGGAGATAGGGGSAGSTGVGGSLGGRGGAGGGGGTAGGSAGGGGTTGSAGRGGAAGGAGSGGTGGARLRRIMPLGDSTTASSCYRGLLWQMLTQAGAMVDFVGTRSGFPSCSVSGYDGDNEGHGGYIVSDVLKAAGTGVRPGGGDASDPFVSDERDLATWFDNKPADIVLLHFATNDVWNNKPTATILQAYTAILGRLRAANPNVRVLVAQMIPLQPSGCNDCPTRMQALNAMIPAWASNYSTAASPISVVDQYTGFNPAQGQDTSDGVHPNTAGSQKIAAKWFNALTSLTGF